MGGWEPFRVVRSRGRETMALFLHSTNEAISSKFYHIFVKELFIFVRSFYHGALKCKAEQKSE